MIGIRQSLSKRPPPVVAWAFNLGALQRGWRRWLARGALRRIDRFVVHSRAEVRSYSRWLGLPTERFVFVPLQQGRPTMPHDEELEKPYVLAMGTAHRDYETLFKAVAPLGFRTIIVAGKRAVHGLDVPPCVEVRSGLSEKECDALTQRARLSVVPIRNHQTASGQITVVRAMQLACPVVATRCIGSEDYVEDGRTGLLVEPAAPEELSRALRTLWQRNDLRRRLGEAARQHALTHFSDEAAGVALGRILDEVADLHHRV